MKSRFKYPLVILPDTILKDYSKITEYQLWLRLYQIHEKKEHTVKPIQDTLNLYEEEINQKHFLELQLKFFLIRNKELCQNSKLPDIVKVWFITVSDLISKEELKERIVLFSSHSEFAKKFGKYYYSEKEISRLIYLWDDGDITLETWLQFKYFIITQEVDFFNEFLKISGAETFFAVYVKRLFSEHVDKQVKIKFLDNTRSKLLQEIDKNVLSRLIFNSLQKGDKKVLKDNFEIASSLFGNPSNVINKCLSNNISLDKYDIHSPTNLLNYFIAIRYYEYLTTQKEQVSEPELIIHKSEKPEVQQGNQGKTTSQNKKNYTIGFKNLPQDKKQVVFEDLKNLFNVLTPNIKKPSWLDIRMVFSGNAQNIKIVWTGDEAVLNFVFRKLNKYLEFSPKKWEAVTHYFVPDNKHTFDSNKLQNNSHCQNDKIEESINYLIQTLTKPTNF